MEGHCGWEALAHGEAPLAGKSTLNQLELTGRSTR